jgi:hypothetical protein
MKRELFIDSGEKIKETSGLRGVEERKVCTEKKSEC